VTPVGLVEPVLVAGRRVSRVSLYHPGHVMAMDMRRGDRVRLELAGDVIPELVEVDRSARGPSSEVWEMPENCRFCGERWAAVGKSGRWECGNEDCPERRIGRLLDFVESREVRGLGEGRVRVLWAAGLVAEPEDLLGLTRGELEELPGFGPVLAEKILASIEAIRGTLKPVPSP
jgi:DNA ligase (NAD+)